MKMRNKKKHHTALVSFWGKNGMLSPVSFEHTACVFRAILLSLDQKEEGKSAM